MGWRGRKGLGLVQLRITKEEGSTECHSDFCLDFKKTNQTNKRIKFREAEDVRKWAAS